MAIRSKASNSENSYAGKSRKSYQPRAPYPPDPGHSGQHHELDRGPFGAGQAPDSAKRHCYWDFSDDGANRVQGPLPEKQRVAG